MTRQQIDEILLEPDGLLDIVRALTTTGPKIPAVVILPHWLLDKQQVVDLLALMNEFVLNHNVDQLDMETIRQLEELATYHGAELPYVKS